MKKFFLLITLLIYFSFSIKSQTTTSNQSAFFSTTNQGMFGPNSTFNLNFTIPIFNVSWNENFSSNSITSTVVGDYGFRIDGGTSGSIGADFYSRNWGTGDLSVDYPVNIHLTYPSVNSFDRGETVTIQTSYTVDPSAQLNTTFPNTGNVGLELKFDFRAYLNPEICFLTCAMLGAFDTGDLSTVITIFDLSASQFTYACLSPSLTCSSPILPATLNTAFGLTGSFDLPNVLTTSTIGADQCLYASGEDPYAGLELEIFTLIGAMNIPYVSPVLAALSGGDCARPVGSTYNLCYDYNVLSASFEMDVINKQDFSFCPEVYTSIIFPIPVQYTVTDPSAGNSIVEGPGQSDSITVKVGNDINFQYPCNYEFMDISTIHDITNQTSNHTYDELSFEFTMSALSVSITLDGFGPGENVEDTNNVDSQTWSFGPLFQNTIPLGTLPGIEWYDNTWELGGFDSIIGTPFQLKPRPYFASAIAQTDVACNGDNTGSFTVNVTNGTAPFTYNWSDGSSIVSSSNSLANSSFVAGNQFVVVEDANGCSSYASYNVKEPAEALTVSSTQIIGTSCNGANDGKVNLSVFGGTTPYSYSWSSGSGGSSATGVAGGNQTCTITDAKGCILVHNFIMEEPDILIANFQIEDVTCFNGGDGIVEILPNGGTAPYSYNWSNGASTKISKNWGAGSQSVTLTDINGCSINTNFNVNEPSDILINPTTIFDVSCNGGQDGSITISVSGGTSPYLYQWSDDNFIANSSLSNIATNLHAQNWTVVITDDNGCFREATYPILEPAQPLTVDVTPHNVSCRNGNDGLIDLTVTGGTPNYNYNWSNGQSSQDGTNLIAGTYSFIVTDANGCSFTDVIEITEPTTELSAYIEIIDVDCNGNQNGEAEIIYEGGTPPYAFTWSTSDTNSIIYNLNGGNYTGAITDANGCNVTTPFTVNEPIAPLSILETITNVDCFGAGNGSITGTLSGGTSPYTYEWLDSYSAHLYQNVPTINNLSPDTYSLVATDANGCTTTESYLLTQPAQALSASDTIGNVLCKFGHSGFIDVTTAGGTIPYNYNWNNGATTEDVNNLTTGAYNLTVTDNNGCLLNLSYFVEEPYYSYRFIGYEQLNVKCYNGNDGYAKITVHGGTPDYDYLWSNGVTTDTNYNLVAGIYNVTITDSNGCSIDTVFNITEPNELKLTTQLDSVTCHSFADGVISSTVTGGTTPYAIAFGDSTYSMMNTANSLVADSLIAAIYNISIQDSNGCQVFKQVEVLEPDTLLWDIIPVETSCFAGQDGSLDLTITGGTPYYSYLWSTGATTEDLSSLFSGNYTFVLIDYNGCTIEGFTFVDQPDSIAIYNTVSDITCIDNEDGFIEIEVEGGIGSYDYLWSNQEVTESIYNLAEGEYHIQVTDANGCTRLDTFYINSSIIDCINPPSAYTPDGDGYNDTWILENIENYQDATILIYNKWGNLIFESDHNYTPWNGTYNGKTLPSATYYYVIELNNGHAPYTGPVTIVKGNN